MGRSKDKSQRHYTRAVHSYEVGLFYPSVLVYHDVPARNKKEAIQVVKNGIKEGTISEDCSVSGNRDYVRRNGRKSNG